MGERPRQLGSKLDSRQCAASLLVLGFLTSVTLAMMGRVWWCQAGDPLPWSWDVWSQHNSQHLLDPYSLSHIQHGLGLFLLLTLCCGRRLTVEARTLLVALVEATWEIAENTPLIINRYRETTMSLDYDGDSILNSISDYAMCLLGVMIARRLRWPWSVGLFVGLELTSIVWIRDSLMLNILMLAYPIDAIRQWQAGM